MGKWVKKIWIILALILLVPMDTNVEGTIDWGTGVYISTYGQEVDSITYNGKRVTSIYAPRNMVADYDSNATFCCAAFVSKFYRTVYGITVNNLYPGNVPNVPSGNGYFYKVSTPQAGDIAGSSEHWAIVKSVSGNVVTLIEQNAWKDKALTTAAVGRKLILPESSYWFWRYSGSAGGGSVSEVYFTDQSVQFTDDHNAGVFTRIQNPSCLTVETVGCRIYNEAGTLLNSYKEACGLSTSYVNYTCNFISDMGCVRLLPGTTYKYQQYAIVNGVEYKDKMSSFTTDGVRDGVAPTYQDVKFEVTSESIHISFCAKDETDLGTTKPQMKVWTEAGGTDDLKSVNAHWEETDSNTERVYGFYIKKNDHNNENGKYLASTDIYDSAGNVTTLEFEIMVSSEFAYVMEDGVIKIEEMIDNGQTERTIPSSFGKYPVVSFQPRNWYTIKDNIESITFEEGIREIKRLGGFKKLKNIHLPDSLLSFGGLHNCPQVEFLELPGNLQQLGDITSCEKITTLEVPEGVTAVGKFSGCTNLTNIILPSTLNNMSGQDTFANCKSLKNIYFPEKTKLGVSWLKFPTGMFGGCSSLEKVEIDENNPYICLYKNLIMSKDKKYVYSCTGLGDMNIVLPEQTEWILPAAFSGTLVEHVELPEGLSDIGLSAFYDCKMLESVTIPKTVTNIGEYAFMGNSSLVNVEWPESCKKIPTECFSGCTSLERFVIPYGVEKVWGNPFNLCNNLKTLVVPSTLNDQSSYFSIFDTLRWYKQVNITVKKDSAVDLYLQEKIQSNPEECDASRIHYDDTVDFLYFKQNKNEVKFNKIGDSSILGYELQPAIFDKSIISWKSENENIVTVNSDGKIIAKNYGVTYVDAVIKVLGEKKTYKWKITVENPASINTLKSVTGLKQWTSTYSTCRIKMSWGKVQGAEGYALYRSTTKNGTYRYIKSVTTTSCTNEGLKAGNKFYYKVRAYKNVDGKKYYGGYSAAVCMLTKPGAPSVTLTAGSKSAKVSWTKSNGASGYEIYMSTKKDGTYTKIKTALSSTFSYTKTGLTFGQKYYIKVRAYTTNSSGSKVYSGWSQLRAVTVK